MQKLTLEKLLERINLKSSLKDLAKELEQNFKIGSVYNIFPMFAGYDDVNCLLTTSSNKFVVKIFSKDKSLEKILSNVEAIVKFSTGGVPVPRLYKNVQDNYIYETKDKTNTFLILMDYFDGQPFTKMKPIFDDFIKLTRIVSKIHNLPVFNTKANYDMWLTLYLVTEFDQKKDYLEHKEYELIRPVVDEMRKVDFKKLNKSIVHFDLHRENIMKSTSGKYAVLDLSGCEYNYTAFDLATFIALFCLDFKNSLKENQYIYQKVIDTYSCVDNLNDYEREIMTLLIKATFASNLLIPSYIQKTNTDNNPLQTEYYKSLGIRGLMSFKDITFL
jgi:Ser/Thr protein kinase RdoA (MazF antagonist)